MSSHILSQASLQSLGCKLWLPLNGDAKDYSGNSNDGSVNGMTYDKTKSGKYCSVFTSGNTVTYADVGASGTILCWKNTDSNWEFDDSPAFISSTSISGYVGNLMNVFIFDTVLSDEQKHKFYNATYIE
jgi:hypothetical protein